MATKTATLMFANVTAPMLQVTGFTIQAYRDAALTSLAGSVSASSRLDPNSGLAVPNGAMQITGLIYGTTYYVRAGTTNNRTGQTVWSAAVATVAGVSNAPTGVSFVAQAFPYQMGIQFVINVNNTPTDLNSVDIFITTASVAPVDVTAPTASVDATTWSIGGSTRITYTLASVQSTQVTLYCRAVNNSGLHQPWVKVGIYSTTNNLQDATIIGTNGASLSSSNGLIGIGSSSITNSHILGGSFTVSANTPSMTIQNTLAGGGAYSISGSSGGNFLMSPYGLSTGIGVNSSGYYGVGGTPINDELGVYYPTMGQISQNPNFLLQNTYGNSSSFNLINQGGLGQIGYGGGTPVFLGSSTMGVNGVPTYTVSAYGPFGATTNISGPGVNNTVTNTQPNGGFYGNTTSSGNGSYVNFSTLQANQQTLSNGMYGINGVPQNFLNVYGGGSPGMQATGPYANMAVVSTAAGGYSYGIANEQANVFNNYNYSTSSAYQWTDSSGSLGLNGAPAAGAYISGQGTGMFQTVPGGVAITSSRRTSLINTQCSVTSTTSPLTAISISNGTAEIQVGQFTIQYPFGTVSYGTGTIYGLYPSTTYYVFCDDVGYQGGANGATSYNCSTDVNATVSGEWRVNVGYIATPAKPASGSSGGGGGAGLPRCTVRGTRLLSDRGLESNETIYDRWAAGEEVFLEGRTGIKEPVKHLEWAPVAQTFEVKIDGITPFECSTTHMVFARNDVTGVVHGHMPAWQMTDNHSVLTSEGWRKIKLTLRNEEREVLVVSLSGPHFEYWVEEGVLTHNLKPPVPIPN